MRAKIMFQIIGVMALLIVGLYVSVSALAQRLPENSITKDIPLMHIDGGGTGTLDVSENLGLTFGEVFWLVDALPLQRAETFVVSNKGVTIELLKPSDSTARSKALVIREIKTKITGEMVPDNNIVIEWDFPEFSKEKDIIEGVDMNSFIELHRTVLIELYNTTKSRVDMTNWQIRFTYSAIPDETDATISRVIDRMSSAGGRDWRYQDPRDPQEASLMRNITMSRQINLELLNDPTKTQNEQLSAISDGTRQTGWDISPLFRDWIEFEVGTDKNGNPMKYKIMLDDVRMGPQEESGTVEPTPPTDDR